MKRRLLTIAHSYVVELNRRFAHELARAGTRDWDVVAVTPSRFRGTRDLRPVHLQLRDDESCPIEVVRAYLTSQVHCFWYGWKLRRILAESWDLVHCWEEPYVLAGWQIGQWTRPNSRLVYTTAQNWSKNYPLPFNWMERACIRKASGWIPFGKTIADALIGRPGYQSIPHRIIPMGVDTVHFQPDRDARRAVRNALDWRDGDPPVVGFLGRFVAEKGVALLMRVLDRVVIPWRALFVGAGPLEPELKLWSKRYGDRVRICSSVTHAEVPRYLNAMDLLCAPSQTTRHWREQFGRMLIESFACGLPVIGSDSGEIPHVLQQSGIVVAEADESAWAVAVQELLKSPGKRHELAALGRERAVSEFAWSAVARQHLDFFGQILEQKK